jgi:phosphoglycerate dehydrogenase-like enzyme
MDVAYQEPLPADDKLWDAPNLLITPHVAGGWRPGGDSSPHMAKTVAEVFLKNLEAYVTDGAMPNAVNPKTGYTVLRR